MRVLRVCFAVSLSFILPISVLPQASTTQTSPQVLALLQQSLAALTGGQSITDITLSGTARRVVGPDEESGTVTLQAIASSSKISLNLPSGTRTETHTIFNFAPVGSSSGPDGVAHPIAQQDLIADPGLFPIFSLASILSNPNCVVTLVGQETKNQQSLYHLSVSQTSSMPDPPGAVPLSHLSRVDFYLDSSTLLPVAFDFNTHADKNARLDLAVEFLFSNYQTISGARIPMRVQKFVNNSLILDLEFANAQLNSGLSASLFNVQ